MREYHISDALPFIGVIVGFGITMVILYRVRPLEAAHIAITLAAFVLISVCLWLPLYVRSSKGQIILLTTGSALFGTYAGLVFNDMMHWWGYLIGGMLIFAQGVIANSTFLKQQMHMASTEGMPSDAEE